MLSLYHQVGHNAKWNIDSMEKDGCGDGLIYSPVHQPSTNIDKLSDDVKKVSFLDPQFYLPDSKKKKLQTYDFFPEVVSGGFKTLDFSAHAAESARMCIEYQISNGFDRIVIPARYFDQMDPGYTSKQEVYTLMPFLEVLRSMDINVPVYFTLPLTSHMLSNLEYREGLLNWLCKFPEITGVYVFVSDERNTKQVQNDTFLYNYFTFLHALKDAGFELAIGYQNTEALLFSLLGDCVITMGSFENTRMFSIDKFLVSDDERRGPKARIYLPGLLNWVQFSQARQIKEGFPHVWDKIYMPTEEADIVLSAPVEPTFNQPGLYKHFFRNYSAQVDMLKSLSISERYELLREWIKAAMANYSEIESNAFDFEKHASSDHLQAWLDAINAYKRDFIS